jgi:probable rRNA maturation factor
VPKKKRPSKPVVAITTEGGPFDGVSARTIRGRAEKMLAALAQGGAELSIALVDDARIRELNRAYRKKDKPTDVLAFAMREGEGGAQGGALGDVVISIDTARRQARDRGRPLLDELTMLLAHGILHLIGYDHRTDREERVMTAKTRELEAAARGRS